MAKDQHISYGLPKADNNQNLVLIPRQIPQWLTHPSNSLFRLTIRSSVGWTLCKPICAITHLQWYGPSCHASTREHNTDWLDEHRPYPFLLKHFYSKLSSTYCKVLVVVNNGIALFVVGNTASPYIHINYRSVYQSRRSQVKSIDTHPTEVLAFLYLIANLQVKPCPF